MLPVRLWVETLAKERKNAMPLEIHTIPCLSDNYAFVIHDPVGGRTACVDVPEALPIQRFLRDRGWQLEDILITHHHPDHIQGVEALHKSHGGRIIGNRHDRHRLPPLDLAVGPEEVEAVCGEEVHILDVPGHTVGHIAFWMPGAQVAFTGDSLMALGCGRLFEGTPAQMWDSLRALRDLPPETPICSGHEYTQGNARFALSIDPENPDLISRAEAVDAARKRGEPTVPSTLATELATNPFLRADDPVLKQALGMAEADDVETFAHIRAAKDRF